jgi:hypothetical protein
MAMEKKENPNEGFAMVEEEEEEEEDHWNSCVCDVKTWV